MNRTMIVQAAVAILICGASLSVAQTVSDEAKRHFDRGLLAAERAKSPEDYAPAIKEFEQAARLAPDWPEVCYALGVVQEKAGKYGDAVANLKRYLMLAPNAADAEAVKSLVNKLEFQEEKANEAQAVVKALTSPGKWKGAIGDCPLVGPPAFRQRDGNWEAGVAMPQMGFRDLRWIPVAYDGKQFRYEFNWYTASKFPFDASVTMDILSASPLRLKYKEVLVQQWGDRSSEVCEEVLEWVTTPTP